MKDQDLRFLRSVFAEYYSKFHEAVFVPPPVSSRELGFSIGPERTMVRHMAFGSLTDVRRYILDNVPWDAYHSCATYESPDKPMEYKTELWVDMAFDIDAKDVQPDCVRSSTYWICDRCGLHGKGHDKYCPECSQENHVAEFMNRDCISSTAKQTRKLCSALTNEVGISPNDITVYFSGHMGFHLYVTSREIGELDSDARREIVSYLALAGAGEGLAPSLAKGPMIKATGARTRILSELASMVSSPSEHKDILGDRGVILIENSAGSLLPRLEKGIIEDLLKLIGARKTKKLLKRAWQRAAIVVDPSVTGDIHRLFRMPGTLNSKSGLPKQLLKLEDVEKDVFSLMPEYGKTDVQVFVTFAPEMEVGQDRVGPFSNEVATIPRRIAAYLVLKGVATVGRRG